MNERIKELADAAGATKTYAGAEGVFTLMTPELTKFAELIVQECVDEIKHLRMNYDTHQDVEPEENDWYIDAFLQAEVKVKKHFGVK
jgi:hypothetical protein